MPDAGNELSNVGCIAKSLLATLDQPQTQVAANQIGPDSKPGGPMPALTGQYWFKTRIEISTSLCFKM